MPRIVGLGAGYKICVTARKPYLAKKQPYDFRGVEVVPLFSPKQQSSEAFVSTLVGVIHAKRSGADLVHIHAIGPALLAPVARVLGLKVVVTHHGADYARQKWGRFAKLMLRMGEKMSMRFAHEVIAVSPSLADRLREHFPRAKAVVSYIPNGAPTVTESTIDASEVLGRYGLEPKRFILAVGRLVPEKGFDYLVEAHRQSGIDLPLVIAGAADHNSSFATTLLDQADERVRFLGMIDRQALAHLYRNAGLFVLPSFHEGLPIAALEAARLGAPTILSDIDANLDVGLGTGNYFPVGDVEVLANRLRRPFSEFAVDSSDIRERFDWDRIAVLTADTYRRAGAR